MPAVNTPLILTFSIFDVGSILDFVQFGILSVNVTTSVEWCQRHTLSWNDQRSRRMFLCFYSAIFQLTSAKFQTFAYNSRMVRSSYMKFWQQFEINESYVCTKVEAIGHVTLVLEPENRPASLA